MQNTTNVWLHLEVNMMFIEVKKESGYYSLKENDDSKFEYKITLEIF